MKMKRIIILELALFTVVGGLLFLPGTAAAQDRVLTEYASLGSKFMRDCKDIETATPPQGDRWKHCLTISKELFEKLNSFHQRIEDLVRQIKAGGRWNERLDQQFYSDAARLGADADMVNAVRRAGGLRAFVEKVPPDLTNLKSAFAAEIAEFEAKTKSLGVASVGRNTSYRAVTKVVTKVIYIAQTGSLAANAACSLSGLCAR
jgi:hypothetical protein